ncbi:hypothetical protein GCM10009648_36250 [Tsukamurella spumae]
MPELRLHLGDGAAHVVFIGEVDGECQQVRVTQFGGELLGAAGGGRDPGAARERRLHHLQPDALGRSGHQPHGGIGH